MGAVGSALDNAMAESFFASLRTELLDRHTWPTRGSLKAAIFARPKVGNIRGLLQPATPAHEPGVPATIGVRSAPGQLCNRAGR